MIDSDRYLRDCCLSILNTVGVQPLVNTEELGIQAKLKQFDEKVYGSKCSQQFRDIWRILVVIKPELNPLRFPILRWITTINQGYYWQCVVRPSELFDILNGIDFSADIAAYQVSSKLSGRDWLKFITKLRVSFVERNLIKSKDKRAGNKRQES